MIESTFVIIFYVMKIAFMDGYNYLICNSKFKYYEKRRNLLINSAPEFFQELLIIFLSNLKNPVNKLLFLIGIQLPDINFLVRHFLLALAQFLFCECLKDTSSQPIICWQSLNSSPSESLFIFIHTHTPAGMPAAGKYIFHSPC